MQHRDSKASTSWVGRSSPSSMVRAAVEPSWLFDEEANRSHLVAVARVIRRLHEAGEDFVSPAGTAPLRPCPAPGTTWLHGDVHYGNLVFRGDEVTSLLDWDFAMPGDGLYDVVTLLFSARCRDSIFPRSSRSVLPRRGSPWRPSSTGTARTTTNVLGRLASPRRCAQAQLTTWPKSAWSAPERGVPPSSARRSIGGDFSPTDGATSPRSDADVETEGCRSKMVVSGRNTETGDVPRDRRHQLSGPTPQLTSASRRVTDMAIAASASGTSPTERPTNARSNRRALAR